MSFLEELEDLINRHSIESGSGTPDFILANYLIACLIAFEDAVRGREHWHRHSPKEKGEVSTTVSKCS
jgi:hypothetical protein